MVCLHAIVSNLTADDEKHIGHTISNTRIRWGIPQAHLEAEGYPSGHCVEEAVLRIPSDNPAQVQTITNLFGMHRGCIQWLAPKAILLHNLSADGRPGCPWHRSRLGMLPYRRTSWPALCKMKGLV